MGYDNYGKIVSEKISRPRWFDALFASPSALAQWENSIYANDDKDDQISTNQVDEIVVPESGLGDVYSCGRVGVAAVSSNGPVNFADVNVAEL
ncbi:predicted protein [Histoplasma mississippiense (nom. inval.)]|uniref:predicted protein n=1 Tax=Ajellomyces capsulatus (strain NAm1 / WU24) TaxID=2059318 RepID=UPI000157C9F4|nr:predicted protein [Histoplasma mississippiense (nom. inval.)]EDN09057.1 predicted protein [Histoplasma mississippiense (nom. inval.)]